MTTSADAALLVSRFQSESRCLKFVVVGKAIKCLFTAIVSEFIEGSHMILKAPGAECGCVAVDLRECQFSYGDAREAPEALRETVEANVGGILGIALSSGEYVFAVETHSESESIGPLLDWLGF